MPFCRFGFEEQLTLEDVRTLINRRELKADDLLLIDDTTQWKRAREIAVLQPYFVEDEPPPRKIADEASVRRKFEPKFTTPPAPPSKGITAEDLSKGFVGLIFIVVGFGFFFSSAGALFKEFDVAALISSVIGLVFAAWGIFAVLRPDKINLE